MEEKRQAGPRVATAIEITVLSADASQTSTVLNLSSGGIFIKADNPLPIDSPLSMWFHLPGDPERMDVQGRVVWIKQKSSVLPAGMGVQFTELSPAHQEKIMAFIDSSHARIP